MSSLKPSASSSPATAEHFSGLAQIYAECRPSYPRSAIEAILAPLPRPCVVADVGCGTGISSRLLADAGATVIGLDPNADMLDQARSDSQSSSVWRSIKYLRASAEDTGLESGSVDAVVCAQSFHWFDALRSLKEFARIVNTTHGRVALMWNVRDDSDPATAAYGEIVKRAQADAKAQGRILGTDHSGDPTVGGYFTNPRILVFTNAQRLDLNGLLGRIRSASYFPKPDNPLRETLERQLRSQFDSYQRDGVVSLMYRTEVTLAERVSAIPFPPGRGLG